MNKLQKMIKEDKIEMRKMTAAELMERAVKFCKALRKLTENAKLTSVIIKGALISEIHAIERDVEMLLELRANKLVENKKPTGDYIG